MAIVETCSCTFLVEVVVEMQYHPQQGLVRNENETISADVS
jgi:hypothetical protein